MSFTIVFRHHVHEYICLIEDRACAIILCSMCVEVKGQLCEMDSVLPSLLRFWGSKSGCQAVYLLSDRWLSGSFNFCLVA